MSRKVCRGFYRADEPPPMGDVLHITRVGETDAITGHIISQGIWGTYTHWQDKRTRRCIGGNGVCSGCIDQSPKRWVGFIQYFSSYRKSVFLLELTQFAGLLLHSVLKEHGSLRGLRFEARRERKTLKAPVIIEITGKIDEKIVLPPEKPIEPTLERLWGIPR